LFLGLVLIQAAYAEQVISDGMGGFYIPQGEHKMFDGVGGFYQY